MPAHPLPLDRIRGVLLGTALGDAAGVPFEGISAARIARRLAKRRPRARLVSDDTEQTLIVARALAAGLDADAFADAFVRGMRRWFLALPPAIGWGTLRACVKLCLGARSGVRSAGNGPAMRAALLGVVARDDGHLDALVRAATRPTHTDPRAEDAARIVALAARGERRLGELAAACRTLELRAAIAAVAAMTAAPAAEVRHALGWRHGVSAYCVDTVPAALWAWGSTTDPGAAIDAAVRLGGDTDTTAAIAGAIAGAQAPHRLPVERLAPGWHAHLEQVARAIAERRPVPRRIHPLLTVPRNLAVGLAFVGLAVRSLAWR